MNIAVKTLGCRSNRYESDEIFIELMKKGHKVLEVNEGAKSFSDKFDGDLDFLIVNTCTVTHIADRKSRQAIRSFKKLYPQMKVVVFGCGVNVDRDGYSKIEEVDFMAKDRAEVLEILLEKVNSVKLEDEMDFRLETSTNNDNCEFQANDLFDTGTYRTRSLLKIQDGCNNFCSYCIIPRARGPERSFNSEFLIEEARKKEALGFKEIVLTGINIGEWQENGKDIGDLCEMLLDATKDVRFRVSSIEPKNFSEKFYKLFKSGRFCPHVHMSLQSGCDSVLTRMKRNYKLSEYFEIVEEFRKIVPNIGLTTDVIVGFPGETDEEFEETLDFVRKVGFLKIHVFPYSKRAQTAALYMKGHLDDSVKKERAKILREVDEKMALAFKKASLGEVHEVLIEDIKGGFAYGYTMNYIPVKFEGGSMEMNEFVEVELLEVLDDGIVVAKLL